MTINHTCIEFNCCLLNLWCICFYRKLCIYNLAQKKDILKQKSPRWRNVDWFSCWFATLLFSFFFCWTTELTWTFSIAVTMTPKKKVWNHLSLILFLRHSGYKHTHRTRTFNNKSPSGAVNYNALWWNVDPLWAR